MTLCPYCNEEGQARGVPCTGCGLVVEPRGGRPKGKNGSLVRVRVPRGFEFLDDYRGQCLAPEAAEALLAALKDTEALDKAGGLG